MSTGTIDAANSNLTFSDLLVSLTDQGGVLKVSQTSRFSALPPHGPGDLLKL